MAVYFDPESEDEDPVPDLPEVPELPDVSEPPELLLPGLPPADDGPPPDCEVPPPLLPALPLSPLRWHADSVPTTSKGKHRSANHRFIAALICRILSKKIDQYFAAPELLLPSLALPEVPGKLLLSVPVPVAPDDVPPVDEPEGPPLDGSDNEPDVDPPPDGPPDLLPSVAPVPAAGVDGSVLGDFVASDGGVVTAGAEELGVVLLVPPVVP